MSKPTEAEILKYEVAHKNLFASLVIANNLWLGMPGKYGFDPKNKTTKQYKAWVAFGTQIATLVGKWGGRQYKLEAVPDSNVEKITPYLGYFLSADKTKQKKLNDIALALIKPGTAPKGMGWVIVLLWVIVAIAAFFTAAYIIDETTTTAQEQQALMLSTQKVLKELNVPPDKAAEIIQETQAAATENNGLFNKLTGGNTSLIMIAALMFILMNNNKNQN